MLTWFFSYLFFTILFSKMHWFIFILLERDRERDRIFQPPHQSRLDQIEIRYLRSQASPPKCGQEYKHLSHHLLSSRIRLNRKQDRGGLKLGIWIRGVGIPSSTFTTKSNAHPKVAVALEKPTNIALVRANSNNDVIWIVFSH